MKYLFILSKPSVGFSGQAAAAEIIITGFKRLNYNCSQLLTPSLDRTSSGLQWNNYLSYLFKLISCFHRAAFCTPRDLNSIHLNLGQTPVSMIRDGVCLLLASFKVNLSRCSRVAALNGSVFTSWRINSLEARLFRWVIKRCDYVSCLGHKHLEILVDLGIPRKKIVIIPNVCEYQGVGKEFLLSKHNIAGGSVEVLFLSSLIDSKGFPEYLEALCMLAEEGRYKINATLCGPVTITPFSDRFETIAEAEEWITAKVSFINDSTNVRIDRIEGARGVQKKALFEKSHIFVLPTRYKVEAQPLAVIEAMASGCAVVTSTVGELPSTVDAESAIVLGNPNTPNVTEALKMLCADESFRTEIALGALKRFNRDFNVERYIDRWKQLLLSK